MISFYRKVGGKGSYGNTWKNIWKCIGGMPLSAPTGTAFFQLANFLYRSTGICQPYPQCGAREGANRISLIYLGIVVFFAAL
jgi:hypothetical protein